MIEKYSFRRVLLLAFLAFNFTKTLGQAYPEQAINLDEFIQKIVSTQQNDINYEDLYENLYQLYQSPLDLNKANSEDLRSLFLFSELQINNLLKYRLENGNLITLYELQAIPDFDINFIRTIAPFVTISNQLNTDDLTSIFSRTTDHSLTFRADQTLEPSRGFTEGNYLGRQQRFYTRYRMQHPKDFSFGFIAEKDAGETDFFDYTIFHAQLQNKGRIKNLIIGDYQASFGQGLVLAAGYFVGKGGEPIYTTRRSNVGLRSYNSVVEGGFFRGGAATFDLGKVEVTAMVARNKRDGSVTESDSDELLEREEIFSSLLTNGFHRTESEIAKKGALNEQNIGVNATYKIQNGHIGVSFLNTSFDKTFQRREQLYNQFEFSGKQNSIVGINGNYGWQNFNFFGEVARSSSGGIGAVGGLVASLSPQVEWSLNLRSYDPNFHSFYSNAFGEGSRTINERGIYTGFKYSPNRSITFSAFYDRFTFPWLRYLVDAPSGGFDYLLRFTYKPTRQHVFYMQYHEEQKGRNLPDNETVTDIVVTTKRQNTLVNFDFTPSRNFKLQSRIQYNRYSFVNYSVSNGFAIMQDIEGTIGKLQLKGRVAYFKTEDFNSRVYAYENDVLYAVSFPAYFGEGMRFYLVSRLSVSRKIDLWARIARTERFDGVEIGSGNNALGVPHRTDVRVQLRYKF
ncbi:MAG: helix-hairpin-helix domain-containing protein [Spirosomaceae bacterium]|nr:helix-hairpin-helix domain-containing protein [Spirosomataceae bacterium]